MTDVIKHPWTPLEHPEVAQLREPMERILESMRCVIERDCLSVVIGDDASGRLPALTLAGVLRAVQHTPPATIFLRGNVDADERRQERFRSRMEEEIAFRLSTKRFAVEKTALPRPLTPYSADPQILVITDRIHRGRGLGPLVDALRTHGLHFQLAAMQKWPGNQYGDVVIHDGKLKEALLFHNTPHLSGVQKGGGLLTTEPLPGRNPATIRSVREDIKTLVADLIERLPYAKREGS